MSFAYVSSPGVPAMRLKNFKVVGTVSEAVRWATSSVVIRESCRYPLIFAVYSASSLCRDAGWGHWAEGVLPARPRPTRTDAPARRSARLHHKLNIDPP